MFIYYLRFHFGSHFADQRVLEWLPYQGESFFDFVVVWVEYLPWFVALVTGYLHSKGTHPGKE